MGVVRRMNDVLSLIGRQAELFASDFFENEKQLSEIVKSSSFLVIGGGGSIGQAVTKEIFRRKPCKLHVVDISENNLVELVRDLRSSLGYIDGDFRTFAIDIGSLEYDAFIQSDGKYDYVLNLSAIKHVRSEKDIFTLMRMIEVNIFNTEKTLGQSIERGVKKYFCVSTDKAANPVNMMGASKKVMEMFLMRRSLDISIATARFANVAFSDGSLLHGFNLRLEKNQPIVAPFDIKRYFLTAIESGQLCLMSCIFGDNRDIFFPKLNESLHLISFSEIAVKYLLKKGYEAHLCKSEEEARELMKSLPLEKKWPCFFTESDTTGEKGIEEFYTDNEVLDMERYHGIGVIKNGSYYNDDLLDMFQSRFLEMRMGGRWSREEIIEIFFQMIPDFNYKSTGKYLDGKM